MKFVFLLWAVWNGLGRPQEEEPGLQPATSCSRIADPEVNSVTDVGGKPDVEVVQ